MNTNDIQAILACVETDINNSMKQVWDLIVEQFKKEYDPSSESFHNSILTIADNRTPATASDYLISLCDLYMSMNSTLMYVTDIKIPN